ncbi:MAG: ABC transporter substrate-binding protein [Pseudonocardiaceae bacterium]
MHRRFSIHPGRRRRCLLVLTAAVVLLAGCTGAGSDEAVGQGGGTLNVAISEEAGVLDPHVYTGNFLLLDMLYEPLVTYGEDGALEPGLASSWKVSEDGRQVVFELRRGVRFHDGAPFDAPAVKWSFDRWVGKEDYGFLRTSTVIQRVEATDSDTVTLTLSEPYEPLIQELSIVRPVRFLSPASVSADAAFSQPVGTGPWRFESSSSTEAVLVRNDDYWGGTPTLERVRFTVIPDSQTRVSALRSGEVDLIGGSYLAPITPLEATRLQQTDGVRMLTGDPDTTFLLSFSTRGPTADRTVREAIGLAIDREALRTVLYSGLGDPAATLFPPGVPDAGTAMDLHLDPARARAVLDAAGWAEADGPRARNGTPLALELVVPSDPVHGVQDSRTSAEAVAAALGEIGITVTIRSVDSAAYLDERAAGNYDLSFVETLGAPYDPSSSVVSYLTSTADAGGVIWTTPELDRLVDAALFAGDPGARAGAYQAIYDVLERDAAFVPIIHRPRLWATGPAVSGFDVPVTEYDLDLRGVTVSR